MKQKLSISLIMIGLAGLCVFFVLPETEEQAGAEEPAKPDTFESVYNVYYGFLHNHSRASDGSGTPLEAYNYARDKAKLDFFSLADHDTLLDEESWNEIKDAAKESTRLGTFIAFHGFEWSSGKWGHVTVINSDKYYESPGNTFTDLLNWLKDKDVIAILNHPGRQDGADCEFGHFNDTPQEQVVGMELWNKSTGFRRYYYNDGYYKNDGGKSYFDEANACGWRIGAGGSDDNHNANWGTRNDFRMGVLAKNLTQKEIYDAFKARRFFSTLDKNIALFLEIGGNQMGAVIAPGEYESEIAMSDGNEEVFTKVELNRNGKVEKTWEPNSKKPIITEKIAAADGDFVYVIVTQKDGDQAISSPIYFRNSSATETQRTQSESK